MIDRSATELLVQLRRREVTPSELVSVALQRIQDLEGKVRAFLSVNREGALTAARAWDGPYARGEPTPPLAGIPIAVKDIICTEGLPTTCGSKILREWIPPYDATVVTRLKAAGAVIVGKTNLDEFAMGSSTENSGYHPTRNPWDLGRVPGGSSGGSAAAVGARMVPLALGTDTGGSIRQPAGFTGVVGLKPTYGRVSRYGMVAYASSLDQIGPLARTVSDVALLLQVIAGHDPLDSTSAEIAVPTYSDVLASGVEGLRLGVVREAFGEGLHADVKNAVQAAVATLEKLGASVEQVSLPNLEYALPTYYLLATSEASSNLARYDGVRYGLRAAADDIYTMFTRTRRDGFGSEVKRRIMLGTYALSAGYYEGFFLKAQQARTLIRRDFLRALSQVDLLAMPVSPTVAFRLGEKVEDPLQMYLADVYTIPVNLAGLPGMSVPCGFGQGMPIGLQLIGKPFDEATILKAAAAYEGVTSWQQQRPALLSA